MTHSSVACVNARVLAAAILDTANIPISKAMLAHVSAKMRTFSIAVGMLSTAIAAYRQDPDAQRLKFTHFQEVMPPTVSRMNPPPFKISRRSVGNALYTASPALSITRKQFLDRVVAFEHYKMTDFIDIAVLIIKEHQRE